MVNCLLAAGVQPILVFDGQRLPSKALTENKRHENRLKYKTKAKEFLIQGKLREARECFQRCTEVTSAMALEVIQACRKQGVDCIVAPYEADAQLAYLSKTGIAQVVITEDSDLVLFGCERILFKMDMTGNGILVESCKLNLCLRLRAENYTFDKFRYMCIMSGCDYIPSLPGIGLAKACKFFSKTTNPDLNVVLTKIPIYLNMSNVTVSKDYIESFHKANQTFLYQLVFDPLKRKLVPLNPYPSDLNSSELDFAGPLIPNEVAYQIALGNVSVETMEKVDNFDPDKDGCVIKSPSWTSNSNFKKSIWDSAYKIQSPVMIENAPTVDSSTSSPSINPSKRLSPVVISTPKHFTKNNYALKRSVSDSKLDEKSPTDQELFDMYGDDVNQTKKLKIHPKTGTGVENAPRSNNSSPTVIHSRFFTSFSKTVPASIVSNENMSSTKNSDTRFSESVYFSPAVLEKMQQDRLHKTDRENPVLDDERPAQTMSTELRGSLFFDKAVTSRTALKRADSTANFQSTSSSPQLSQRGNFGNWSSLRTYFSYPSMDVVARSPRNHTEFKQVKAPLRANHSPVVESKKQSHAEENEDYLSQSSMSESMSVSINCSQTSRSQLGSIDDESFQLSQLDELVNESTSPINPEENDENLFNELNSPEYSSSQLANNLILNNRNNNFQISKVSKLNNGSLPGRCKRPGLSKLKSPLNRQTTSMKQLSVKETLAKFGFTKNRYKYEGISKRLNSARIPKRNRCLK